MRGVYLKKCIDENNWGYSQTEAARELKQRRKVSRQQGKKDSKRPIAHDLDELSD